MAGPCQFSSIRTSLADANSLSFSVLGASAGEQANRKMNSNFMSTVTRDLAGGFN